MRNLHLSKIPTKKAAKKQRKQAELPNTSLSLPSIKPLTRNQQRMFDAYYEGKNLFLHGVPGSGKSFLALYLAFEQILGGLSSQFRKVVIVRSAVPSRDIGFLPGSVKEKIKEFEAPYIGISTDLFGRGDAYSILKGKGLLEFISTSFVRGTTIEDAIVILEEIQNFTFAEAFTILTRVGRNCRVIATGDFRQHDLKTPKDLFKLIAIVKRMKSFSLIEFEISDIVRSGFVKEFLIASIQEDEEWTQQTKINGFSIIPSFLEAK